MINNSFGICNKCNKKAVVDEHIFYSITGINRTCLNWGWFSNSDFLDKGEIENIQENYKEEFELLKERGIIEISKEKEE